MYFRLLVTILSLLLYASLAAAAPFAYIANSGADSVTAIDAGATPPAVTATITLPPSSYPYSVSVSPNGVHAYVACQDSLQVAVIDTITNAVVRTLSLTYKPGGLAVNAAETRLYVADNNSNTLTVIDISRLFDTGAASEVSRVPLDASTANTVPEGVVLNPAGNKLYVANAGTGKITVVNVNDVTDVYTKAADIALDPSDYPMGLALNTAGSKLYVANMYSGTVALIDTATNALVKRLNVDAGPLSVAINPNPAHKFAYVPSNTLNTVRFIDTGATPSDVVLSSPAPLAGQMPWGIAVTPDGSRVLVVNNKDNTVSVLDAVTGAAVTGSPITVGTKPTSMGNFMSPAYQYVVNVSIDAAGTGTGSVAPGIGAIPVTGFGRSFFFTPNSGSVIDSVTLNGVAKGAPTTIDINNITADQNLVVKFATTGSVNRQPLTIDLLNIGGRVYTTPAGIDITSGTATAQFDTNTNVDINVDFTANPTRQIKAWGGACASTSIYAPKCTVTMDAAKSVTIEFKDKDTSTGPVYIPETNTFFQSIASALLAATDGQTIKVLASYSVVEDLMANNSNGAQVSLSTGWNDQSFSSRTTGNMTRVGSLIIQKNALIADNISIQ